MRRRARAIASPLISALLLALACALPARADWMQPDETYREQLLLLRLAARDTTGHGNDPGRLDSLGVVLLKLARLDEAKKIFGRSFALNPAGETARAALGKLALFDDRLAEAESLLAGAPNDPGARVDLFSTQVRRGEYEKAAALAREVDQEGWGTLLTALADRPIYEIAAGINHTSLMWAGAHPVPLVRVKLNGRSVLMGIDTGIGDLLIDESTARLTRIERVAAQRTEFWLGSRIAVQNAIAQQLEISGLRISRVPAGIVSLRRWSLDVHPHDEPIAGIIGLNLLRRFTTTLDYKRQRLELAPLDRPVEPKPGALRVPFQIWGVNELTVFGSLAGSRRMAMVIQTGVPGCGVGAPPEVFQEIGVKSGVMSRLMKSAGSVLNGRPWSGTTIPTVTIGPMVRDKVPAWIGALDSSEMWRHGVRRDALLSSELFRGRRVTIDWSKRELVIEE